MNKNSLSGTNSTQNRVEMWFFQLLIFTFFPFISIHFYPSKAAAAEAAAETAAAETAAAAVTTE